MPRYTKTLSEKLCVAIAEGKGVRQVCIDLKVNRSAFYQWLAKYDDFLARYQAAQLLRAEFIFDEMLEIADDGKNDTYIVTDKKTGEEYEKTNYDVIQRSKLRVETRRYILEVLNRSKYTSKVLGNGDNGELKIIVENSPDVK